MAISFSCSNPECGRAIKAPDHAAGRQAPCPACGTVLDIPHTDAAATGAAAPPITGGVICPDCNRSVPNGASLCAHCGWVNPAALGAESPPPTIADRDDGEPDVEPADGSLVTDCLTSITYASTNVRSMVRLVMYSVGLAVLLWFILDFFKILVLLGGAIIYVGVLLAAQCTMGGYFLRFYLDCAISSLEGADQAPDVPEFDLPTLCKTGLKGVGIACVYVLPLITLPLLPLGLLAWSYTDDWRVFDLRYALRAAAKKPTVLVTIWGATILWYVAGVAMVRAAIYITARIVDAVIGDGYGLGGVFSLLIIAGLSALVIATIVHSFMAVIFRCIGMLGRHHPELLDMLPENDNPAAAVGFIALGIALSVAVIAAIVYI